MVEPRALAAMSLPALGIRDPEDLYIAVWLTIELIAAVLAYVAIMKLWRWYSTK